MTTEIHDDQHGMPPLGLASTAGLGVYAEDMAAMRMQATALAFQWFTARGYTVSSDGYAFFLLRARDFGFKNEALPGLRIRVALSFERDA